MNPDNPIIQILPLPRQLPPTVMWSMYSIIAASLLSAITVVMLTSDFNSPSAGSINVAATTSSGAETSAGATATVTTERTTTTTPTHEQWLARLLRDTINYECQFHKPNVASYVTWATDRSVLVQHAYKNSVDHVKIVEQTRFEKKETTTTTTNKAKEVDGGSSTCNKKKNKEMEEEPPKSFHRLVSSLWSCPPAENNDDDDECRFNVKIMSTAMAWEVSNKSRELVDTFTQLSQNHSGDYTYSYKQAARDTGLPFHHRCLYRVQLFRKRNTTTKYCYIKTLEDHDYGWGSPDGVKCKYTFTVTEGCPEFSVTWTDEFTLDSSSYEYSLFQPTIPRRGPAGNEQTKPRRFPRDTKPCNTVAQDKSTEYLRICNSEWYVQKFTDPSENAKRHLVYLAVTRKDEDDSEQLVKLLTKGHHIVIKELLAVRLVAEDESVVFFTAAPLNSHGYKYLYSMRIVFPPMEDKLEQPVQCQTCLTATSTDDEKLLPVVGEKAQCSWAEVQFSPDAQHYIIDCRGPKVPWVAVASSSANLVKQLIPFDRAMSSKRDNDNNDEPLSSLIEWRNFDQDVSNTASPTLYEHSRLFVPRGWFDNNQYRCQEPLKLLVFMPQEVDQQTIRNEYEISLYRYLAALGPFAVLHSDFERKASLSDEPLIDREAYDLLDRSTAAQRIVRLFDCIDQEAIGVIGERFGGHMSLKFASDNDCGSKCHVALKPWTTWQYYVRPFTIEPSTGATGGSRRRVFRREYLRPMVKNLVDKSFAVEFEPAKSGTYESGLVEQLEKEKLMNRVVRLDSDEEAECHVARGRLYEKIVDYLKKCFELEQRLEKVQK